MQMQISIKNFRGIRSADITMDPIALVCGHNAAGKSSIAQAAAALLTGNTIPVPGIKKSESGMLIHSGQIKSGIGLNTDSSTTTINYPAAKMVTQGNAPSCSQYAAGMKSFVDLDQKAASLCLKEYLDSVPTFDDLKYALPDLSDAQLEKLWQTIEDLDWDGAHARARETGVRMKGQWEEVTGERYGSAKATNWLPDDWDPEVESMSEESLQARLVEAREWMEACIATAAVSEAEREELKREADLAFTLENEIDKGNIVIKRANQEHDKLVKAYDELPKPADDNILSCPGCGMHLSFDQNQGCLSQAKTIHPEESERRKSQIIETQKLIEEIENVIRHNTKLISEYDFRYRECIEAKEKLESMGQEDSNDSDSESAREAVRIAQSRLNSFQLWTRANKLHKSIEMNQVVVSQLAPNGIRMQALQKAITEFNEHLDWYCQKANWKPVKIDEDLSVLLEDRPYPLLSESEKFRVKIILQMTFAQIDGSDAVIIDAADILDKQGRNGLFKLVMSCGKNALILMTMDKQEDIPDLSSRNMGNSYWVENGIVK